MKPAHPKYLVVMILNNRGTGIVLSKVFSSGLWKINIQQRTWLQRAGFADSTFTLNDVSRWFKWLVLLGVINQERD